MSVYTCVSSRALTHTSAAHFQLQLLLPLRGRLGPVRFGPHVAQTLICEGIAAEWQSLSFSATILNICWLHSQRRSDRGDLCQPGRVAPQLATGTVSIGFDLCQICRLQQGVFAIGRILPLVRRAKVGAVISVG